MGLGFPGLRGGARHAVGSHDPQRPSPPFPLTHTHISSNTYSLGLCVDVLSYCTSRRFHVQSFGHVFQVQF